MDKEVELGVLEGVRDELTGEKISPIIGTREELGLDRLPRNVHCSRCGDTRGGPVGHETSECTWAR